jgi:hypothetical protein
VTLPKYSPGFEHELNNAGPDASSIRREKCHLESIGWGCMVFEVFGSAGPSSVNCEAITLARPPLLKTLQESD